MALSPDELRLMTRAHRSLRYGQLEGGSDCLESQGYMLSTNPFNPNPRERCPENQEFWITPKHLGCCRQRSAPMQIEPQEAPGFGQPILPVASVPGLQGMAGMAGMPAPLVAPGEEAVFMPQVRKRPREEGEMPTLEREEKKGRFGRSPRAEQKELVLPASFPPSELLVLPERVVDVVTEEQKGVRSHTFYWVDEIDDIRDNVFRAHSLFAPPGSSDMAGVHTFYRRPGTNQWVMDTFRNRQPQILSTVRMLDPREEPPTGDEMEFL